MHPFGPRNQTVDRLFCDPDVHLLWSFIYLHPTSEISIIRAVRQPRCSGRTKRDEYEVFNESITSTPEILAPQHPTAGLTVVAALPSPASERRACVKASGVEIRVFRAKYQSLEEVRLKARSRMAGRRICIGRFTCFPPRPRHCFRVTTAWQPGKMGHGQRRK